MLAANEQKQGVQRKLESGRGVYDTHRAAALSGVPLSTLHYWARTGLYSPSIALGPRTRLWSWADLLALRALDWFRKGDESRARASVATIRQALAELEHVGYSREDLAGILAISSTDGKLYLQLPDRTVQAHSGGQLVLKEMLPLVAQYRNAPDLLRPRPMLRIIPGKLHGEPHIVDTRIPSQTIAGLAESGFDLSQIHAMYPDATPEALREAIDFERSLASATAA